MGPLWEGTLPLILPHFFFLLSLPLTPPGTLHSTYSNVVSRTKLLLATLINVLESFLFVTRGSPDTGREEEAQTGVLMAPSWPHALIYKTVWANVPFRGLCITLPRHAKGAEAQERREEFQVRTQKASPLI